MTKTSTLKLTTYECKIVLMITDNIFGVMNSLFKKHKILEEFEDEAEGVMMSPDMSTYYLIIDSECITHNTIAHEAFHIVHRVMEDRDISDDESGAWIAGHVSEFIYKSLDKKKFEIKHG